MTVKKAEILLRDLPQDADGTTGNAPASQERKPFQPRNAAFLPSRRDSTLGQIAAIRARLGDLRAADQTMNLISSDYYMGWAARSVAEARARAGDVEGALAWALTLQPESVRFWALRGLATGALAGP